jgi:hypothetical protein
MPVIVTGTETYVPAPQGLHAAVCVGVIDRGIKETPWGKKPKVMLVWEIETRMENGRPFTIHKHYTRSLHEKSNLHKDLEAWRGKSFTPDEIAGFDLEKLLGTQCQVTVEHKERCAFTL